MDMNFKQRFLDRWQKYFPGADLPITFYYSDSPMPDCETEVESTVHCFVAKLGAVRKGRSICLANDDIACMGGKRYLGFSNKLRPNFPYFLSCGIPGELEGERYKKTPEIVEQMMALQPPFTAPAKYIVWKRFDRLEESDKPLVVVFFATPDILSGLFTLVNYEESELDGVIVPMGAGCASIVQHPLRQASEPRQRAVLGMFDVSARPHVPSKTLTLSISWAKFSRMVVDMDESFLVTKSWEVLRKRIEAAGN
jgi:uncharacterized protein (DUF169 family)